MSVIEWAWKPHLVGSGAKARSGSGPCLAGLAKAVTDFAALTVRIRPPFQNGIKARVVPQPRAGSRFHCVALMSHDADVVRMGAK